METLRRRELDETAKLLRRLRDLPRNEQENVKTLTDRHADRHKHSSTVSKVAAAELKRRYSM